MPQVAMGEGTRVSPKIPNSVLGRLKRATPDGVRFIKLGRKSAWWPVAKESSTLRLGFKQFDYDLCRESKWEEARRKFLTTTSRKRPSDVTRAVQQVREFFELPDSTLWVTIEDGDVWWCFAHSAVKNLYTGDDDPKEQVSGARLREVIDVWRNTDIKGERLRLDSMTTKITKVASFQETICKPSGAADLL
jgi:hypothetical protein